jgi:hypothetical protein
MTTQEKSEWFCLEATLENLDFLSIYLSFTSGSKRQLLFYTRQR